jgi:drug/metabolite transporter (DMT)-like permease
MESKPLLKKEDTEKPTLGQRLKVIKDRILTKDVVLLLIYVVLYVTSGVINSIFLKKVMNAFQNYPFFLNQLTNYGYIPIFGSVVLYEILFTKLITKEMRVFPWWKFLIMGALDAVCGYFVVIGGIDTSGPMQQLLNQAIIPVTMIGAFFILKERYSIIQAGGAVLIVVGVVVSLLPSLLSKADNTGNVFFWNMFYLCQVIPFAASNVYKDIAFKSVDMDVWYLQFWDVFWQSVFGTMLFPINTILPPPAKVSWSQIPGNMRDGALCLIGQNLIVPDGTANSCELPHATNPCDRCDDAWIVLTIYMAINVAYNVFILLVIKYGSATVLSIAQTIRLPLTNICFSFKFIMGKDYTPFKGASVYGLLVILAGLISYRVGALTKKKPEGEDGEGTQRRIIPHIGPGGGDYLVESISSVPLIIPKTSAHLRKQYLAKLGVGLNEPHSINA